MQSSRNSRNKVPLSYALSPGVIVIIYVSLCSAFSRTFAIDSGVAVVKINYLLVTAPPGGGKISVPGFVGDRETLRSFEFERRLVVSFFFGCA